MARGQPPIRLLVPEDLPEAGARRQLVYDSLDTIEGKLVPGLLEVERVPFASLTSAVTFNLTPRRRRPRTSGPVVALGLLPYPALRGSRYSILCLEDIAAEADFAADVLKGDGQDAEDFVQEMIYEADSIIFANHSGFLSSLPIPGSQGFRTIDYFPILLDVSERAEDNSLPIAVFDHGPAAVSADDAAAICEQYGPAEMIGPRCDVRAARNSFSSSLHVHIGWTPDSPIPFAPLDSAINGRRAIWVTRRNQDLPPQLLKLFAEVGKGSTCDSPDDLAADIAEFAMARSVESPMRRAERVAQERARMRRAVRSSVENLRAQAERG